MQTGSFGQLCRPSYASTGFLCLSVSRLLSFSATMWARRFDLGKDPRLPSPRVSRRRRLLGRRLILRSTYREVRLPPDPRCSPRRRIFLRIAVALFSHSVRDNSVLDSASEHPGELVVNAKLCVQRVSD